MPLASCGQCSACEADPTPTPPAMTASDQIKSDLESNVKARAEDVAANPGDSELKRWIHAGALQQPSNEITAQDCLNHQHQPSRTKSSISPETVR